MLNNVCLSTHFRDTAQISIQRKSTTRESGTQTIAVVGGACTMLMVASMKGNGTMTREVVKECLD